MQTDTGCSGAWFGRRGETQITEGAAQKGTLQNKGLLKSPVLSCLGRRPGGGSGGQGEKVVPQPNCVPWCLRDFLVSRGTGHVHQEPRSGWRVFCQASAPLQEEEVKNMTLRLGESLLSNNTFTTQRLHTSAIGPANSGEPWSNHHQWLLPTWCTGGDWPAGRRTTALALKGHQLGRARDCPGE